MTGCTMNRNSIKHLTQRRMKEARGSGEFILLSVAIFFPYAHNPMKEGCRSALKVKIQSWKKLFMSRK